MKIVQGSVMFLPLNGIIPHWARQTKIGDAWLIKRKESPKKTLTLQAFRYFCTRGQGANYAMI